MSERIHKKACHRCGGDMTVGQMSRQKFEEECAQRDTAELESTYAHIRSVIENCKRTRSVKAIRHQLVGLLPEVQTYPLAEAKALREKGLGHLVDRRDALAREGWAEHGFTGEGDG